MRNFAQGSMCGFYGIYYFSIWVFIFRHCGM